MTNYKYSFRVVWSGEDDAFVATCPELPGVVALGETEADALREAKAAMELYIEDMLESGEQLPEPQTAYAYSGQTRVRMSKAMHRMVAERANDEGISLNQFINDAIAARLGAEDLNRRLVRQIEQKMQEMEQRLLRQTARNTQQLAYSLVQAWEQPSINAPLSEPVSNVNDASEYVYRRETKTVELIKHG